MMAMKERDNSGPDSLLRGRWTSLTAFLLVLLFAGAADGLMDVLGPGWFLAAGALVMGLAWALERIG